MSLRPNCTTADVVKAVDEAFSKNCIRLILLGLHWGAQEFGKDELVRELRTEAGLPVGGLDPADALDRLTRAAGARGYGIEADVHGAIIHEAFMLNSELSRNPDPALDDLMGIIEKAETKFEHSVVVYFSHVLRQWMSLSRSSDVFMAVLRRATGISGPGADPPDVLDRFFSHACSVGVSIVAGDESIACFLDFHRETP